jgi:hypothetical protein
MPSNSIAAMPFSGWINEFGAWVSLAITGYFLLWLPPVMQEDFTLCCLG